MDRTWPVGIVVKPQHALGEWIYPEFEKAFDPEKHQIWCVCRTSGNVGYPDYEILYTHHGLLSTLTHEVFLKARKTQVADLFMVVTKELREFRRHREGR